MTFPKRISYYFIFCLWAFLQTMAIGGCCYPVYQDYSKVPSWIYQPPSEKDAIYVVGAASLGMDMSATLNLARDRALENLAKVLSFKILSQEEVKKSRNYFYRGGWQKVLSKAKLHAIEEARWIDREGITGEVQAYVLMKIPVKNLKK